MNPEAETKETIKLYSQTAISIATYFGGPLAAGILTRRNFINLGKEQLGKNALIIGIISTMLLFVGIFSIPQNIIDKIPNIIIPLFYTIIINLVVDKYQGSNLKEHKQKNRPFYSVWKATGIGIICMLILLGGIFSYAFLSPEDFDTKKYDNGIAEFNKNEEEALQLFVIIENSDAEKVISHIDSIGLPAWERNLKLLEELDNIEGLYDQFKKQNETLRQYTKLRMKSFALIRKAIIENTNKYDKEIDDLNRNIDKTLTKL